MSGGVGLKSVCWVSDCELGVTSSRGVPVLEGGDGFFRFVLEAYACPAVIMYSSDERFFESVASF